SIERSSNTELNVGVPGYGGGIMLHLRDGRIIRCGSVEVMGR
ncbi:MAG: hypothetical protein ACI9KE_004436, partial [Polyangiales bacterium]